MIQLIVNVSTKAIGSSVLLFPECDPNDTIGSIKLKISEQTGIPPEQQRLIVLGQLMLDENTLSFYNIKRGERTIVLRDPLTTEGTYHASLIFNLYITLYNRRNANNCSNWRKIKAST